MRVAPCVHAGCAMKVVVLGGTGVFGTRIVDMLTRDGHDVISASRSGTGGIAVDRAGDLAPIWDCAPDVLVDAAGPFHAYGDDPYRVPRAAIEQRVSYLDLADDPDFCAGIATLDAAAAKAGVFVLSGVSSVPALSSAIASDLVAGAEQVDQIESAILPGNQTPRGRSVVATILHQVGTKRRHSVDRQPRDFRSWSQRKSYDLTPDIRRSAYLFEVPDQSLLPDHFNARSVQFRAGLELGLLNHGLAILSALRLPRPNWLVSLAYWVAARLEWAGSDVGGMVVQAIIKTPSGWMRRRWRLVVREGEGPYIPGIAVRALLRDTSGIEAGARPALSAVTALGIQAAMEDLAAEVTRDDTSLVALFDSQLGDAMAELPLPVRDLHAVYGPRIWQGRARVTRGTGWFERLLAAIFRFPPATADVNVTVTMQRDGDTEVWTRCFGGRTFRSHLRKTDRGVTERFGPFTFLLGLRVLDGALEFPVQRGWFLGVPLPKFALPVSHAREDVDAQGRFTFDVALSAPLTKRLMVRYQGYLVRDD